MRHSKNLKDFLNSLPQSLLHLNMSQGYHTILVNAQSGDRDALNAFIAIHQPVVHFTLSTLHEDADVETSDLTQAGFTGLLRALKEYMYGKGDFVRFAATLARQEMCSCASRSKRPVSNPRQVAQKARHYALIYNRLEQKLLRQPRVSEIAGKFKMQALEFDAFQRSIGIGETAVHIENDSQLDSDYLWADLDKLTHHVEYGECDTVNLEELHRLLTEALSHLSPKDSLVIRKRFGLDGDTMTLQEIANIFGVTREAIRQRESAALKKIQRHSYLRQ